MSNPFLFFSRRSILKGAIASLVSIAGMAKADATVYLKAKVLTPIGARSLKIELTPLANMKSYIEYGSAANRLTNKSSIESLVKGKNKTITITGLTPNSNIYFRVRYAVGTSKSYLTLPISTTKTSTETANSVFAVQADPHMDENSSADVYNGTLKQIVTAAPAFLMDLGDIFMVDKLQDKSEANIRARFELMKGYYAKLGTVPLKITLGNHDGELGYSKFNTKNYRKEYFPEQTGDLAYFSLTGPDQLHIALDPFTYTTENPKTDGWQWTLGKTQYDWLKKTLEESSAKYKFVYIHHLLVGDAQSRGGVEIAQYNEWGGKNKDGTEGFAANRAGWAKPVHQLLVDNKVSIVFKGHDHLYVKQELDGIIYQTVPQPSHPGDRVDPTQYGYASGKCVGGSGFIKVSTDTAGIKVDFVKFDGSIADSYTRSA